MLNEEQVLELLETLEQHTGNRRLHWNPLRVSDGEGFTARVGAVGAVTLRRFPTRTLEMDLVNEDGTKMLTVRSLDSSFRELLERLYNTVSRHYGAESLLSKMLHELKQGST